MERKKQRLLLRLYMCVILMLASFSSFAYSANFPTSAATGLKSLASDATQVIGDVWAVVVPVSLGFAAQSIYKRAVRKTAKA